MIRRCLLVLVACSCSAVPQPLGEVQVSGCPTETIPASLSGVSGPTDYVELQRGRCFGSCPVYSVRIYRDGRVAWNGNQFVQAVGQRATNIAPEAASGLIDKFGTSGFWGLCDRYARMVTDLSATLTTVHVANAEKSVSDYADAAPDWLRELNTTVDKLADVYSWIHGDPRDQVLPRLLDDGRGPKPGLTDLMQAAWKGNLNEIKKQLAAGANPNAQDSSGATALFYATRADSQETLTALLQSGADPNIRTYKGQTALMAASISYQAPKEKIKVLLAAGAELNARDNDGQTALTLAERYHSQEPDVVAFLRSSR